MGGRLGTHLAVDTVAARQHVLLKEKKLKRYRRQQREPIVLNMNSECLGYNLRGMGVPAPQSGPFAKTFCPLCASELCLTGKHCSRPSVQGKLELYLRKPLTKQQ